MYDIERLLLLTILASKTMVTQLPQHPYIIRTTQQVISLDANFCRISQMRSQLGGKFSLVYMT